VSGILDGIESVRIVSLVPSLTETLVSYGLAEQLVGRTTYCTEPSATVSSIETVGGTKNPDLDRILDLDPDLVVLNREENRLEDAERLRAAGLELYVTHPRSVVEAVDMLAELGAVVGRAESAEVLCRDCRDGLDRLERLGAAERRVPTFCPIWRRPWMTFGASTYIGDMLAVTGFANVYGVGEERRDFFEVNLEDVVARRPPAILLPDEPYCFRPRHARELAKAGIDGRMIFLDGKLIAWYGPRLPSALRKLAEISASFSS